MRKKSGGGLNDPMGWDRFGGALKWCYMKKKKKGNWGGAQNDSGVEIRLGGGEIAACWGENSFGGAK